MFRGTVRFTVRVTVSVSVRVRVREPIEACAVPSCDRGDAGPALMSRPRMHMDLTLTLTP